MLVSPLLREYLFLFPERSDSGVEGILKHLFMKISVLVPDLSNNCLGRAYLLAKILQIDYEVEIVGPLFGDKIWPPVVEDKTIPYKFIKSSGAKFYLGSEAIPRSLHGIATLNLRSCPR